MRKIKDYKINLKQLPYGLAVNGSPNIYTYYNPNEIFNYWDIQQAVFSTGQMWIVQDFFNSNVNSQYYNQKIDEQYGESGFKVTLKQNNFKISNVDIVLNKQRIQDLSLERKGKFESNLNSDHFDKSQFDMFSLAIEKNMIY